MAFNTGNPVPSTDARDLYDNAQNLDKFSNGQELEYEDRLGVARKSLAGIRQEAQDALSRLRYQNIGDYAAGLLIENYGEVFRRDGEFYRANAELNLPYTLTGDWASESASFVSVGDAVLRQELAGTSGATLVGFGNEKTDSDLSEPGETNGAALIAWRGRTQADRNADQLSILDFPGTDTEKFQAAFALGGGFFVPGGEYELSDAVAGAASITLTLGGPVTVKCTAPTIIPAVFKTSGLLKIDGGPVTIDCDSKAYLGFHCPVRLPTCSNVTVKNSLSLAWCCGAEFSGASANSYSGANGVGDGYLDHCFAENCGSLGIFRGSGKTSDTSFQLRECGTDVQTGFVTNIFNIGEMRRGSVLGGNYRGVPTQAPNMTRTAECEYIGGLYEGLVRGPTVGEGVESVTMVGGVSKNIASYGISCDARITSDNTVPEITGTVDWTCIDCERDAFVQAGGVFLKSINGRNPKQSSNASVRLTDAKNVKIGTLISTGAGAKPLLELGAGGDPVPGSSAILLGGLYTDSTNASPFRLTNASSSMQIGRQRMASSNYRATWQDETIIADATAGSFTIYFPEISVSENLIGKKWTVKVRSTVNSISLARQGGGATAINGASSYSIGATGSPRAVEVEALGDGNYLVSVSV